MPRLSTVCVKCLAMWVSSATSRLSCNTAPTRIAELREAVARADVKGAASAAHALKSMSLNIGAQAVVKSAAKISRKFVRIDLIDLPGVERLKSLAKETFALLLQRAA